MNPLISIKSVTKSFTKGKTTIKPLENLSLDVPRGEFLSLMGPSGSGKTTLLNLIAGIDTPTSGEIFIDGNDIARLSRAQLTKWRAKHVGYIFQLYHLVPILSALDLVGLGDRADHRPSELSGGQEQRVAIARAIVHDPELLVADEPTGDLDRESADSILRLLDTLATQHGKTIVMVTHDPKASASAHRALQLEKGQFVEEGHLLTHA